MTSFHLLLSETIYGLGYSVSEIHAFYYFRIYSGDQVPAQEEEIVKPFPLGIEYKDMLVPIIEISDFIDALA